MLSDSHIPAYTEWYRGDCKRLFNLMTVFLNLAADYIEPQMIEELTGGDKSNEAYAFAQLSAAACGLDVYGKAEDRRFFREMFLPMFRRLDPEPYKSDPYYTNIKLPEGKSGKWTFEKKVCKPYEAFVYDDPEIRLKSDGTFSVIPKIGFFDAAYPYPAVLENGREWMTLMPNETNTSREAVEHAHGRVLTYGLGLGYFAYMAAIKPGVESVTVVETSSDAVALFKEFILPQFPETSKIRIELCDAFEFAAKGMTDYDFVFTDIWHDPSDGCELYLKMKEYEKQNPGPEYIYWIEKTLRLYL